MDVVVVGAGQAGLAMSRELARRDLEHVVFLRKRKSSLFLGVGEDAAIVAHTIATRRSGAA